LPLARAERGASAYDGRRKIVQHSRKQLPEWATCHRRRTTDDRWFGSEPRLVVADGRESRLTARAPAELNTGAFAPARRTRRTRSPAAAPRTRACVRAFFPRRAPEARRAWRRRPTRAT